MSGEIGFWDSSALVPLCVQEASTTRALSYLRKYEATVWWGSLPEIRSAISRLHRMKQLSATQKVGASARLDLLSRGWKEILPTDLLRGLACDLLDKYALRSADSLQLAAALTWCQERPANRVFVCGDQRLSEAAEMTGFSVLSVSQP